MQSYHVELSCEIPDTFRTKMAANSLDIDVNKKSKHELKIDVDIDGDYSIGLIVGASGSGKTTLAKHIFGEDCFKEYLDLSKPVIDQFPKEMKYDDCAKLLSGVGLTSVPCWIRPAYTLSNGQKARAEAALSMVADTDYSVIDEWTSVVDRTVAKVMSHCVQKFTRRQGKKLILNSCHYDVVEWLDPDWIIDCNQQKFIDRRLLRSEKRERKEKLKFEVKEVGRSSWKFFSKYHYLSDRLPGGKIYTYGLFEGKNQIGFMCLANYIPTRKGNKPIYHSNRVVIHPDYAGFGLGIMLVNKVCEHFKRETKYELRATFSSVPLLKSRLKDKDNWVCIKQERVIGKANSQKLKNKEKYTMGRLKNTKSFRSNVTTYTFRYIGP